MDVEWNVGEKIEDREGGLLLLSNVVLPPTLPPTPPPPLLLLLLLAPPLAPKTFSPAYLTYKKPSSSFDCSKTSASVTDVGGNVNDCSCVLLPRRPPLLFVFLDTDTKTKSASCGDIPIRRLMTKTS